ncbi:sushi, von Willebrand factor type A, EGF and pentraxin domain-containing protein 1 [Trichonephila clavipes]|nr:sushi, von Willebrand factor type A, EGF and pentraxin domain-containing protein 1 [Trichonephila clavipes]
MGKCFLRCKKGYNIAGINYTTCQTNRKWGAFPTCRKISCPEPDLSSSILKVNGECSGKFYQDACFVTCREGGQLIGEAKIKCEDTGVWSSLPLCTCPVPNSSGDLILKNCKAKRPDEHCFVECKTHLKLIGDAFFMCQKNTKWSIIPKCIPKICPLPSIPEYLEFKGNCTFKKIGENCEVSCKHGGKIIGSLNAKNTFICLESLKWNSPPVCTCSVPEVYGSEDLKESCSFIKPKEKCFIVCKIGYKLVGPAYTICQHNAVWNPLATCVKISCPSPIRPSTAIRILGECKIKYFEDVCQISCAQGGELFGQPFIKCLRTRQWGPFPICSCPSPNFSAHLKSTDNCFSIKPGEKCDVECENNLKLVGTKSISCDKDSMWSEMPNCVYTKMYCPKPVVEYLFLNLEENCSEKSVGEACKLGCKGNSQIKGNDSIECLKNLQWSTLPQCVCPLPHVSHEFENLNNCSFKMVNEKCEIKCKSTHSTEILTCRENREWTPLPYCPSSDTCDVPLLPVYLSGKCGPKKVGERCMLDCRSGGNIVGLYNYIQCLEGRIWSIFPDCTCPLPNVTDEFEILEDCSQIPVTLPCKIKCKSTHSTETLTCTEKRNWSPLPYCPSSNICDVPLLPVYLSGKCGPKKVGERCMLDCRSGGNIVGLYNYIQCLEGRIWSIFPDCTCPLPNVTDEFEILEDCSQIPVTLPCKIKCKSTHSTETLTCTEKRNWSPLPYCPSSNICDVPLLPVYLSGKCGPKKVGEHCMLDCRSRGNIVGMYNYIQCLEGRIWSILPDCTCPVPSLDKVYDPNHNCHMKKAFDVCSIKCALTRSKFINITCQENRMWSVPGKCRRPKLRSRGPFIRQGTINVPAFAVESLYYGSHN